MRAYYPESAVLNLGLRPLAVVTFPLVKKNIFITKPAELYIDRDLSEISRGGGGVGILNLGSEIR